MNLSPQRVRCTPALQADESIIPARSLYNQLPSPEADEPITPARPLYHGTASTTSRSLLESFVPHRGFVSSYSQWQPSHSLPVRSLRMPSDVLNHSTTSRTIGVPCRDLRGRAHFTLLLRVLARRFRLSWGVSKCRMARNGGYAALPDQESCYCPFRRCPHR